MGFECFLISSPILPTRSSRIYIPHELIIPRASPLFPIIPPLYTISWVFCISFTIYTYPLLFSLLHTQVPSLFCTIPTHFILPHTRLFLKIILTSQFLINSSHCYIHTFHQYSTLHRLFSFSHTRITFSTSSLLNNA